MALQGISDEMYLPFRLSLESVSQTLLGGAAVGRKAVPAFSLVVSGGAGVGKTFRHPRVSHQLAFLTSQPLEEASRCGNILIQEND